VIKINCDLCGKVDENLKRAIVESTELNVCSTCSRFGKVLGPVSNNIPKPKISTIRNNEEKVELLIDDYTNIIKKGRESMGLSQKDFAKKINEKESVIHKIETGSIQPSLSLAKKLGKMLNIKLIEEYKETHESLKKSKDVGFTMGDFIKSRK